jgi:hypothetical protein
MDTSILRFRCSPIAVPFPQHCSQSWFPVRTSTDFWCLIDPNHILSPRDGLQISIAQFDNAIEEALGFSPEFAHTVTTGMLGKLGVLKNIFSDALLRIDLNATNAHNKTEHDASLSRLDANQGDAAVVRPNLVQEMLDDTVPESFNCLNTSSIGWTRARRQRESVKAGNPPLSDAFVVAGQGEAALMLLIMGDGDAVTPENGDARCAPKERVQTFFDQERFPYELGFKVPARIVQADEVVPLSGGIAKYEVLEQNSDRSQSLR